MMNSIEFANYLNERDDNDGVKHSDSLMRSSKRCRALWRTLIRQKFPGIGPNADGTGWAGSKDAVYANTDWYDYYFKKASIRHSHNLSVTGGSDKFNYYVGLGYIYQEGLLDQVDDNSE